MPTIALKIRLAFRYVRITKDETSLDAMQLKDKTLASLSSCSHLLLLAVRSRNSGIQHKVSANKKRYAMRTTLTKERRAFSRHCEERSNLLFSPKPLWELWESFSPLANCFVVVPPPRNDGLFLFRPAEVFVLPSLLLALGSRDVGMRRVALSKPTKSYTMKTGFDEKVLNVIIGSNSAMLAVGVKRLKRLVKKDD